MTTGMITVAMLAVSAALCAVATVSFYRSNVFNDKRKNYLILLMGIAATLWNVSLIGYSISRENISDVIYNEAHIAILALDQNGKVDSCNEYARKLLGMEEDKEYMVTDLFSCNEQQLQRILEGKKLAEHLMSQITDISCNVQMVASRDNYGDSYGVVVMASDATSEEKVMEQQILIEKTEHISDQLVHILSKTIEAKDQYTKGHSTRVAKYSVMIGQRLGYDRQALKQLEYAALLHDVGKIGVADAYDAMTSNRSYRNCLDQKIVWEEIERGMGKQFDPQFAEIMLRIIDEDTDYQLHEF